MAIKKRKFPKKRAVAVSKASRPRGNEEMGRGQVWSVDVLLAVVIFVSVILVFYVTMNAKQKQGLNELESEVTDLKVALEQDKDFGFIQSNTVDEEKFQAFMDNATANYTWLKNKLGVKGDFCIFYEDADGHVIVVDNKPGIGNSSVLIDGYPCGVDLT